MAQLALRKWGFEIWGCTDGSNVSKCKVCKLDQWECVIFKEATSHKFLYTVEGDL